MNNHPITRKHPGSRHNGGWHVLWPVWALCTILLAFGIFVIVREYREDLPQKSDVQVVALSDGQDLHLDSRNLVSPQLHLFEASTSRQKVKFVVQRTPDQIVHVAVASCRVCYKNRNSHYAKNGEMICGKCEEAMDFESKGRQARTNHCALVEIPHAETGHEVTVLVRDVLAEVAKLSQ
jgi:uncharacterized membrane protein